MKRILAIDDEEMCLDIISISLRSAGFDAVKADSGAKAIEILKLEENNFDLILLDMMMPNLSGKETLIKIREIKKYSKTPVLFQTGASDVIIKEKENLYIISKPYKREDLLAKINSILSQ